MADIKILLVEDEKDLRTLMAKTLKDFGYTVHEAADGEEGLKKAQEIMPDLIVSDVVMPKMDGNQFYKALRQKPFGKDVPFIILTARFNMKDYFEVVAVDDFLEKPFKSAELITRIQRLLKKKKGGTPAGKASLPDSVSPEDTITISDGTARVVGAAMSGKVEIQSVDAKKSGRKKAEPAAAKKQQKKKKVLIVDDNKIVYETLQRELAKHNCDIKVVNTPATCLAELNRFLPDIILSKYVLAEMNADAMANVIKEMPRFTETPIIIYGDIGRETEADNADAKTFILNAEGYEVLGKMAELLS